MVGSCLLWLGAAMATGGTDESFRVQIAEGVVVCFVPASAREGIRPFLYFHADGTIRGSNRVPWVLTNPLIGSTFLGGHPDGRTKELDIEFVNEAATSPLTILTTLWQIRKHSESAMTRLAIIRPNAVVYIRSARLDDLKRLFRFGPPLPVGW